jgi:dTDP-4-amino-4,6-dideoxygalactose transaminase
VTSHTPPRIPFNRPFVAGKELYYIAQAVMGGHLAGDGAFSKRCSEWMEEEFSAHRVLLTHSCTAALEMAALLCDIGPGDEVIMPSYTFVSTANAFVLRGATIRFVDIRPDTLNIDERAIESAINPRTRAIVPVHYGGVGAEMDTIMRLANEHGLVVIEDAAQGVTSTYRDRYLGTIGHLGAFSFHETKNLISGEGGALVVNDERYVERAEIIREKGTNRSQFFRGQVDKYTWVDIGSSYLPSEIVAAFLFAQLEEAESICTTRKAIVSRYAHLLRPLESRGLLQLPFCPSHCRHNAHMFSVILRSPAERDALLQHLKDRGILAVFHYVPLHTSPMGQRMGYEEGQLPITEDLSRRLARLPCYFGLSEEDQDRVVGEVFAFFD